MRPAALPSRIEAVTVYRRGARITRVADAELAELPPAVRIAGLPLGLDDSSVRARVEGDGAVPVAFDLRVALDVPEPDAALAPADDAELEAATLELARLEGLAAQIGKELARLYRLALVARPKGDNGQRPPRSPVAARQALIRFRVDRERALRTELVEVRDRIDLARMRCNALLDRRRRALTARQAREHELRKSVVVSLRGAGARFRLVLEYQVPGACWAPAYTIRLGDRMADAVLGVRAVVAQNSGEDWTGVAMTLSTAQPTEWTELPELASIRIGRRQPPAPKVGWRPPPAGLEDLYQDWDRAFRSRAAPRSAPAAAPALAAPEAFGVDLEALDESETLVDRKVALPPAPPGYPAAPGMIPPPPARPSSLATARPMPPAAEDPSPAAPWMAKSAALRSRRAEATGSPSVAGQSPTDELAPALAGELEVGRALLQYGDLRIPPASAPGRGRLTPASRHELYLQLVVEQRIELRFDVVAAVERARGGALEVASRVPRGCELAWSQAFDYAYPAESRVDVPSDGDFHSIPLAEKRTESEARYVVVPRESTDIFRTATVANPLEAPLLPGPIDVYLEGDFLLTTRLELTPPRGRFALGLGVEQAIKVARNTRFREEIAGLMGGALLLHHQIDLEIRNNLAVPAPIEVRERVPVTADGSDEVAVRVAQASPPWEEWRQDQRTPQEPELRGGRRWRVTVPAGGVQELRAEYEVKISAKQELVGGNRREA